MYSDILDDHKIAKMSPKTFKIFVFLLALTSDEETDGVISLDIDDMAWRFRITKTVLQKSFKELEKLSIIETNNGEINLINWDKRQFKSDDSNERVKKYRENRKKLGLKPNLNIDNTIIFSRDNNRCVYCGSSKNLCVDHIIPIVQGGTDDQNNLVTACKQCNSGKSGRTPDQAGLKIIDKSAMERLSLYLADSKQLQIDNVTVTETPPYTEQIQKQKQTQTRTNGYAVEKEFFQSALKTYKGTKRGLEVEFDNFIKKHKDWKSVLPELLPAIENRIEASDNHKSTGAFFPEWANFSTWINQRKWEEEYPTIKTGGPF